MSLNSSAFNRFLCAVLVVSLQLAVSNGCNLVSNDYRHQERLLLSVLDTIPWQDAICDKLPCSLVIVDTSVYQMELSVFRSTDSVAFTVPGDEVIAQGTNSVSFLPGARWTRSGRTPHPDTAYVSVGINSTHELGADSLLMLVQIVLSDGSPRYAYVGLHRENAEWKVDRFWMDDW